MILSTSGKANASRFFAYGIGASAVEIRFDRSVEIIERVFHHVCEISAPTDAKECDSSAITRRFVFFTELTIVSISSGLIVRGSMTSTETSNSCWIFSAACNASGTVIERATIVQSVPSRFTSATPSGIVKSSSSGTSPFSPYIRSCSMKMTGLSSRIDDFQQSFRIRRGRRLHDLQAGKIRIHRFERMRVLRRNLISRSVRAAKNDRHLELPAGHVEHLRGVVDDLVGCENRKVPRHELDHGPKPGHRRTDADRGKSELGDRSIDDTFVAELLPEPARHLISAVVLGDFLAHDEDVLVSQYFFAKRLIQCVADR